MPFLFRILKCLVSFLSLSLTLCPSSYCAVEIYFKGLICERVIFFIRVIEINHPFPSCMSEKNKYNVYAKVPNYTRLGT